MYMYDNTSDKIKSPYGIFFKIATNIYIVIKKIKIISSYFSESEEDSNQSQ